MVALALALALAAPTAGEPVLIGLDLEFGHRTSTSATAIKQGALIAIDEVNKAGGVLGGRPLAIVERDNRSNPARGVEDFRELAAMKDLVAVMGGKFSPVFIEQIPLAHELGLPLLDPWSAVDAIIDHGRTPSFTFRLSLRDGWAMPALLDHARTRGLRKIGLLLANTEWGRSNERAARAWLAANPGMSAVGVEYFNFGVTTLGEPYRALRAAGATAIVLVANEPEGAVLVKELAALPASDRLPVLSHWGITGGDFASLCGAALSAVDLVVVQTFTFAGNESPVAARVGAAAKRLFGLAPPEAILSSVGLAHAYDLVHILARAVDLAGSTDRRAVRDALERVRYEQGLVRRYGQPFAPDRHEALRPDDLFMARWNAAGVLVRAR